MKNQCWLWGLTGGLPVNALWHHCKCKNTVSWSNSSRWGFPRCMWTLQTSRWGIKLKQVEIYTQRGQSMAVEGIFPRIWFSLGCWQGQSICNEKDKMIKTTKQNKTTVTFFMAQHIGIIILLSKNENGKKNNRFQGIRKTGQKNLWVYVVLSR